VTPFGLRIRELRKARGVSQKEMAAALGVTPAYLSALEHGRRGVPSWAMLQKIIGYFNVIWDEAEALARLAGRSRPRVTLDTAGLSPRATALANRLAETIAELGEDDLKILLDTLEACIARNARDQNSDSSSSSRSLTSQP
jgi:transcriptional regulator with XRE-family HTH domain